VADKFEFLSDDWFAAARKLRDDLPSGGGTPPPKIKMNMIIIEAPFNGGAEIKAFMDSSSGEMQMDEGELSDPEVTVTVDWPTAKAIFVDQNAQAAMQAFMSGKVKIQGDPTKLMAMQAAGAAPDPAAQELADKIKDITA
jgi:hypothetical protein